MEASTGHLAKRSQSPSRSTSICNPPQHADKDCRATVTGPKDHRGTTIQPSGACRYHEWFPFFDSFNSVIHSNPSLSNIQRLQYLKASLADDACNVISSLEISDRNYDVAWNLLKDRYDNKRVIVHTHIKAIMELPSINKENAAELRQIADGATRHIQALQALKRPTQHWDDLLVHILASKLDAITLREWQASLVGTDPPTFRQFSDFITHRCQMLEATCNTINATRANTSKRTATNTKRQTVCVATVKSKCTFCDGEHAIYYCKDFLALPIAKRISETQGHKICSNCLRSSSHASSKCPSQGCKICKAKHNMLLHQFENKPEERSNNSDSHKEPVATSHQAVLTTHARSSSDARHVMLSTAVVDAFSKDRSPVACRVLLDSGSQANFISRECVKTLKLQPQPLNVSISGINKATTKSTHAVQVKLQSRFNSYNVTIQCIVTDQITCKLPTLTMKRDVYDLPRNLKLADPQFNVSAEIDVLLGAEVFWDLLCVGQIKRSTEHPTLQKTHFGWILAGCLSSDKKQAQEVQSFHATITNTQLHEQLSRFWQIEDIHHTSGYTAEETLSERHFLDNVSQNSKGRYIVKLPIKESKAVNLGQSKDIALKRLLHSERRLSRNPGLKMQYVRFMNEYLTLGHMKRVDVSPSEDSMSYYLPHHCVFKGSRQSSKIRVVFDASCKSSTGVSLNDVLRVGPVVQQDLMSIVMRFRTTAYVMVADIIKMYRQVLIHPSQTCLQRILWRSDSSSDIGTYELVTVTYGTSSASFLATRCLKHLAEKHSADYPIGSRHVQRDFYVDDLLTGADTLQDARAARDEIISLLKLGSFELSKWASNCPQLLDAIDDQNNGLISIRDGADSHILGIQWNPITDTFHFSYETEMEHNAVSKRFILSKVARLFDPLGLLGPTIVIAKLILQDLWKSGVHWDESVPQTIHT
ncbi:uncharacterized protein [Linepithema humile]|uniref:uncharacterized protein n=1 Tax=Linepithema humile TaxID=83485 RepID=UPI0006231C5F|nr:PREDICTED: uncharacterized protein LOC105677352 [Linepithema humile]